MICNRRCFIKIRKRFCQSAYHRLPNQSTYPPRTVPDRVLYAAKSPAVGHVDAINLVIKIPRADCAAAGQRQRPGIIQRKDPFIFQQNHTFPRCPSRQSAMRKLTLRALCVPCTAALLFFVYHVTFLKFKNMTEKKTAAASFLI